MRRINVQSVMIVACATITMWGLCAWGDTYRRLCPQCGKTWWTDSPLDNFCGQCRKTAKEIDHKFESTGTSDVRDKIWQSRRDIQKGYHERQRNFSDFMAGLAEKRAQTMRNLTAEQQKLASGSDFSLEAALSANLNKFPLAVQKNFLDYQRRNFFCSDAVLKLGGRQEETYNEIVRYVRLLESPSAQSAIDNFWANYANRVTRMGQAIGMGAFHADIGAEVMVYTYVAAIVMRAYDPQFALHSDRIAQIERQFRGNRFNPNNLPPDARRLREQVLGRFGGAQNNNNQFFANNDGRVGNGNFQNRSYGNLMGTPTPPQYPQDNSQMQLSEEELQEMFNEFLQAVQGSGQHRRP